MNKPSFPALGLSPEILKAVAALGFEEASPIQAAAIPVLLTGRDVVGQSQTGSGKTAAFTIPAIERLDPDTRGVQVLILCPTRELATQVADEVHKLAAYSKGVRAVPIYGGASYERQFYELKRGVQLVIGTPGRVMDHLERGTLRLDSVKTVILDEADRMLDMGFRDDIQKILDQAPPERQTVFFSATLSSPIRSLIGKYSVNPETVKIEQKEVTVPTVEQYFYEMRGRGKVESLIRLIDYHGFNLGIIFCNTQRMVDELADTMLGQGFAVDRLHGGIPQAQRTRVMNKFKKAEFEFLVATDVAARGIDVDELEIVVNFDLPYDAEDYVHRIGRTGRAGKKGLAATFVSGREIYKLQYIERYTRTRIKRANVPTSDEVQGRRTDALHSQVRSILESGDFQSHKPFVDRLLDQQFNATDIAAALLRMLREGAPEGPVEQERAPVLAAPEPPPRPAYKPRTEKPKKRESQKKPRAPRNEEETPVLRKPSRGMQWVALNVGRSDRVTPRDVVDILAGGAGLPARTVGMIELTPGQTFAQVDEKQIPAIKKSMRGLRVGNRPVKMEPVRHGSTKQKR